MLVSFLVKFLSGMVKRPGASRRILLELHAAITKDEEKLAIYSLAVWK